MIAPSSREGKMVCVGWDGRSNAIIHLVEQCGCHWTRDGKYLVRPCNSCLIEAMNQEADNGQ